MAFRRRVRTPVHVVTKARSSRYDDIAERQRRYLITMAIRTAAVLVAFFAPLPLWGRLLAVALGLVLPWISVTAANAGPLPQHSMTKFDPNAPPELPAGDEEQRAP